MGWNTRCLLLAITWISVYRGTKVLGPQQNSWSERVGRAGDILPLTSPVGSRVWGLPSLPCTAYWQTQDPTRWQDSLSLCYFYFRASALESRWAQPHCSVLSGSRETHTHHSLGLMLTEHTWRNPWKSLCSILFHGLYHTQSTSRQKRGIWTNINLLNLEVFIFMCVIHKGYLAY